MELSKDLTVGKWGNGLAIRLPVAMKDDLELTENSKVSVTKSSQGWVIKAVTSLPKFSLAEMVSKITTANLPETADDNPVGKEVW